MAGLAASGRAVGGDIGEALQGLFIEPKRQRRKQAEMLGLFDYLIDQYQPEPEMPERTEEDYLSQTFAQEFGVSLEDDVRVEDAQEKAADNKSATTHVPTSEETPASEKTKMHDAAIDAIEAKGKRERGERVVDFLSQARRAYQMDPMAQGEGMQVVAAINKILGGGEAGKLGPEGELDVLAREQELLYGPKSARAGFEQREQKMDIEMEKLKHKHLKERERKKEDFRSWFQKDKFDNQRYNKLPYDARAVIMKLEKGLMPQDRAEKYFTETITELEADLQAKLDQATQAQFSMSDIEKAGRQETIKLLARTIEELKEYQRGLRATDIGLEQSEADAAARKFAQDNMFSSDPKKRAQAEKVWRELNKE